MELLKSKISPTRQAYLKWRSLRNIPFRTKFFVGFDLDGNTYWEFHDPNNPDRLRRIVEYKDVALNWVDYKCPPQWVQWLRHARPHYPTLQELHDDKVRQELLKIKVQLANEKWKSIPLKNINQNSTTVMPNIGHHIFQPPSETHSNKPESSNSEVANDIAAPEKKVLRSNPSDAFEPGTWSVKKPAKRG